MIILFVMKEAVSKKSLILTGFLQSIVWGVFHGTFCIFDGGGNESFSSALFVGSFITIVGVSFSPETDVEGGRVEAGSR